jgi:hypothetical protein
MAPAMMCPAHGPVSGQSCVVPGCFEPLRPYVEERAPAPDTCSATGCDMPPPCPLHLDGGNDAAHREIAAYLATSPASPQSGQPVGADDVALEFPWGPAAVPADGLTVGRDFGAECGCEIEEFGNVSRLHARITVEDGNVFVEDLNSVNGTTVNSTPTIPLQRHPVVDDDVLGFGAHLRVSVTRRKPPR